MRSRVARRRAFSVEGLERRDVPSAVPPGPDVAHAAVGHHHAPPSLYASTISSSEIDPTWTAVAGARAYRLQGRPAGTAGWYPDNPDGSQVTTTALTYRDTGLAAGTRYEYRVRATGKAGKPLTDWSTTAAAVTYRPSPMLSATPASPTEIDLTWTAVAGATRYEVQARQPGMTFWYEDVAVGTTTYRSMVPAGSTWDYRVRATDAARDPVTDWSAIATATAPAGPTG
jgi:hypothetical protein